MAITDCCGVGGGLVGAAVLALLLVPVQYYVPDLYVGLEEPALDTEQLEGVQDTGAWYNFGFHFPPLDFIITSTLFVLSLLTYLWEWIHRKLMERRLVKLNQYLGVSLERLREWDAQQEQLETTLKMVQNATSEYNLLLYLLLRQHRCVTDIKNLPDCIFEKAMEENFSFLRSPTIDM